MALSYEKSWLLKLTLNLMTLGYWDCPFCDTKGIEDIKKECLNCGKPRKEDTKFYMKGEKNNHLIKDN